MSEPRWSVETLSATHSRIAIDSNVLIHLLEETGPRARVAGELIDAIEAGRVHGSMATLGLAEVLAGPARHADGARFELLAAEVRSIGLRFISLDAKVAEDAAWLRGAQALGLADAVHLASARVAGATAFVTDDQRIRSTPQLAVVRLDDAIGQGEPPVVPPPGT